MSAATVYLSESNGAGEVVTDNISNINFGSVDEPNIVAANHPIIQGENSFVKFLRVAVPSLGDSTTIKDLRVWKSAGALVTDEVLLTYNVVAAPYETPTTVNTMNVELATSDPGTANWGIAGSFAGTITAPGYSNYKRIGIVTGGSTPVGPVNQKTITVQYDET